MQLKQTLLTFALIFCSTFLSAQIVSSSDVPSSEFDEIENISFSDTDWTFYMDEDNKTYYIDFETISVNLNDMKVYDENGQIVIEDELWNLPVNTIYELNLADVVPGNYKVELRTYTGKITKEITVAD